MTELKAWGHSSFASSAIMTRLHFVSGAGLLLGLAVSTTAGLAWALTPLSDLGTGLYLDQFQGGLYPGGSNEMPTAHAAAGLASAAAIVPRDTLGVPDPLGSYALVSIGMSNTTQEFCGESNSLGCASYSFAGQSAIHPSVDHDRLVLINGAKGGSSAISWDSPTDPDYDRVRDGPLAHQGLSELQVAAAWVKVANPGPSISLPAAGADAYVLVEQMGDIARSLKVRYPNIGQAYLSSRIYGGYATGALNPEPYAYEAGLAVKWLIEAQINQMNGGGIDPVAGDLNYLNGTAPWLAWGPYMWADGLKPRSDGLTWEPTDFSDDGTHPSLEGRTKVANELLDFFLSDPSTQPWFLDSTAGDFDSDGDVDGRDFLLWQQGASPNPFSSSDLAVWQAQYGNEPLAANAVAVPEPNGTTLLLVTALSCWRPRRSVNISLSIASRNN